MHHGVAGRRPVLGWDEQDVFTHWRRMYCYCARPGRCKYVKRKANRRERRLARMEILLGLRGD